MTLRSFMRIGAAVAAQMSPSAVVLVMSISAARNLSTEDFGGLAIVTSLSAVLVGVVRALSAEPMLYRYTRSHSPDFARRSSQALSAAYLASAPIVGIALVSVLFGGGARTVLLGVGIAAPALAIQDVQRVMLIASSRSAAALRIDILGLILTGCALLVVSAWGRASIDAYAASLAFPAAIAALVGNRVLRPEYARATGLAWFRGRGRECAAYVVDFLVTNGVSAAAVLLIGLIAGLAASASVRGAQLLLLPILILTRGVAVSAAPRMRTMALKGARKDLVKLGAAFSGVSLALILLLVILAAVVPVAWIEVLLGDSASGAMAVWPAAALAAGATALAMGPGLVLRAVGRVTRATLSKLIAAPVSLGTLVFGSALYGAAGGQLGIALAELLRFCLNSREVALWWRIES